MSEFPPLISTNTADKSINVIGIDAPHISGIFGLLNL